MPVTSIDLYVLEVTLGSCALYVILLAASCHIQGIPFPPGSPCIGAWCP